MFGKILGNILAAPARLIETIARPIEESILGDSPVADFFEDTSQDITEATYYYSDFVFTYFFQKRSIISYGAYIMRPSYIET